MLYLDLKKSAEFLKSKYWKMFVLIKTLSEYFLSKQLSEYQVDLQTKVLHQYMSIRLSLIDEDDWSVISPKHTFSMHYSGAHISWHKCIFSPFLSLHWTLITISVEPH